VTEHPPPDDPRIPPDLFPESRSMMAAMIELGLLDIEANTVDQIRSVAEAEGPVIGTGPPVKRVEEIEIEGPEGTLPLRIYHPPPPDPQRAILFLHGGGWVLGDLDHADADCRRLCIDTGSLVVAVDYRLAPEHPFPAGLEDAYAALSWLAEKVGSTSGPRRLVVGGDSAGGNLTAALTLLARERGGPTIDHQLLIYPVTDRDFETDSYRKFGDGYLLTRVAMELFWASYVPAASGSPDALAAVLQAEDLSGLPPATVVVAGCDVLRDEAEAYLLRLRVANVWVDVLRYPGQLHSFWTYGGVSDIGRKVNADILTSLESAERIGPGGEHSVQNIVEP
jgi:acetyl esterase